MSRLLRQRRWLLLLLLLLLPSLFVAAVEQIELRLPQLDGLGLAVEGLDAGLTLQPDGAAGGWLELASLEHAASGERLRDLRLECHELEIESTRLACNRGRFELADWRGEPLRGPFTLRYMPAGEHLQLSLGPVTYAEATLLVAADYRAGRWEVELEVREITASRLQAVSGATLPEGIAIGAGHIDLQASARGQADRLQQLELGLQLRQGAFSNTSGLAAAEALSGRAGLRLQHRDGNYSGDFRLALDGGGLYLDPVYTDFSARPLQLAGDLSLNPAADRVALNAVALEQTGTMDLTLAGELSLQPDTPLVQRLQLEAHRLDLAGFFPTYAGPWLAGTAFSELTARGELSGELSLHDDRLAGFDLKLDDVGVEDPAGRLSLNGIAGNLAWGRDGSPRTLRLGWQGGSLYRLSLGRADFHLRSEGNEYRLLEPAEVEVLDGRLLIDEWSLTDPGAEAMRWHIDAILTPVSMTRLTAALGWPRMQGQLSGVVPDLRYADGRLEVGGMLLVRVFDGAVRLRELRLEQPLGLVPQLNADIELDNLDLEQLTGTFAFGRIEGRLDGHIRGLWLQNWQPLAFDAALFTPEDDTSRHRISQRAVDNLSRIGGGVGQALSQTFLGLFEEFPYDRLGIRCRLRNGVCEMGGVAPAEEGYYLVRGTWLPPRINVIGYADAVDWTALLARLQAATAGGTPQIQ